MIKKYSSLLFGLSLILILSVPNGLPYSWYIFLRIAVFLGTFFIAYNIYKNNWFIALILLFVGILFNPFVPFHLTKETWIPIDLITSALFFILGYKNDEKKTTYKNKDKAMFIFSLIGYFVGLYVNFEIGYALGGAFFGAWIGVFFITFILKE